MNILVLEDDVDDRYFITELIKKLNVGNYQIFSTIEEFLTSLDRSVHICIVDHFIPGKTGMTGIDIVKELKQRNLGSFVIVYTGNSDPAVLLEYMNSGADRGVGKWQRDHLERLERFVREAMSQAKENVDFVNYLMSKRDYHE